MAPRALSTYVVASKNEFKRALGISTAAAPALEDDVEDTLSDCLEFASDEIERFLGRKLVTRGAITEYHTPSTAGYPELLYLTQFPVILFTSVSEGYWSAGAFVVSQALTSLTHYISDSDAGTLIRISDAGSTQPWLSGFETIRVVYTAGYATTADIPQAIRSVAVSLAARRYAAIKRGNAGAQSFTDALGTVTRFLPAELLQMEQNALLQFRRFLTTGRAA